jgi:hypothetical protein
LQLASSGAAVSARTSAADSLTWLPASRWAAYMGDVSATPLPAADRCARLSTKLLTAASTRPSNSRCGHVSDRWKPIRRTPLTTDRLLGHTAALHVEVAVDRLRGILEVGHDKAPLAALGRDFDLGHDASRP